MAGLKLFVLGHPVAQSRSPMMQNAALAHLGLDATYATLDVHPDLLSETLARLDADPSVLGCNVTVPHKVAVYEWLAARGRPLMERSRIAGAVNTLFRGPDGRFGGQSTDFDGAMDATLREAFRGDARAMHRDLPGRDVAILGSGGSALSISTNIVHPWSAFSDHLSGIGTPPAEAPSAEAVLPRSVTIFARDLDKARAVADALGKCSVPVEVAHLADFPAWNAGRRSLVFQTTTVGMEHGGNPGGSPVAAGAFETGQIAFDLVYKPHDTNFLLDARSSGAAVVHGIGMLVGQGARSLEIWAHDLAPAFDRATVTEVMARALM